MQAKREAGAKTSLVKRPTRNGGGANPVPFFFLFLFISGANLAGSTGVGSEVNAVGDDGEERAAWAEYQENES